MDKNSSTSIIWDLISAISIIGIWPRYIEPRLLRTSHLSLKIPNLSANHQGIKIVQISDLHINSFLSDSFLQSLTETVNALQPDIIVITGDLICYGNLDGEEKRLETFLKKLSARHGCFVVLGNHDYAEYVTVGPNGDYVVDNKVKAPFSKAFKRIFKPTVPPTKQVTPEAQRTPCNKKLNSLLDRTHFSLLHNETVQTIIKGCPLNITGLGEYTLARAIPSQAFQKYQQGHPGIVLLHNPDGLRLLDGFQGDVVLCGHTHGGQVNLPWVWKKLTILENMEYKQGLFRVDNRWVYVNRGIGGNLPYRWFASPEILSLTLEAS